MDEVVKDEGAEIGHSRGEIVEVPPSLIKPAAFKHFIDVPYFCMRNSDNPLTSSSSASIVRTGCKELIL